MSNFKMKIQDFGKSLLFPIALLSFMAIFTGVGSALQNPVILSYIPVLTNSGIQTFISLIRKIAGLPFTYLPILFTMAIPLGMVKRDKEVAVFSAVVGYIALLLGMSFVLEYQGFIPDTTAISSL